MEQQTEQSSNRMAIGRRIMAIRWGIGIVLMGILGLNLALRLARPDRYYGIFGTLDLPRLMSQYGVVLIVGLVGALLAGYFLNRRQQRQAVILGSTALHWPLQSSLTIHCSERAVTESFVWILLLFFGSLLFGAFVRVESLAWFAITLAAPLFTMLLLIYQISQLMGGIERITFQPTGIIIDSFTASHRCFTYGEIRLIQPLHDTLYLDIEGGGSVVIDTLYFALSIERLTQFLAEAKRHHALNSTLVAAEGRAIDD